MTTFEYAEMVVMKLSEAEAKDIAHRIEAAYNGGSEIEVPVGYAAYRKCFAKLFDNKWSLSLAHDAAVKILHLLAFKKKIIRITRSEIRRKERSNLPSRRA